MRKGLTLIELVLSMLIIAIVFSVVPKIIFASNKSMASSMKEDALFNAYTLLGTIYTLTWDENVSGEDNILGTDELGKCNKSKDGRFTGSRECKDSDENASNIGHDNTNNDDWNDIDDYNSYEENITVVGKNKYKIYVDVNYVDSNYENHSKTDTKELKEINVTIEAHSDNKKMTNFKSSFFYYSANLGLIPIKKRQWK